jgi:hypothetical protein
MISPLATLLGIKHDHIYANVLTFDNNGSYNGYDINQPTSRSGGKAAVIDMIIKQNNYKRVIMIGDGATDMEARPPASAFIGYGGIVTRPKVKAGADWFVTDFQTLIKPLTTLSVPTPTMTSVPTTTKQSITATSSSATLALRGGLWLAFGAALLTTVFRIVRR